MHRSGRGSSTTFAAARTSLWTAGGRVTTELTRVVHDPRVDWVAVRILFGVAAVVGLVTVASLLVVPGYLQAAAGTDVIWYLDHAREWLASGTWYSAEQLAGPYDLTPTGVLYPPTALALFVPFTVLPLVLWWAIPITVTAAIVWWHRPSRLGWAVIAACLAFPMSITHLLNGNPVMWVAMLLALSTRWGWVSALVLPLKPSLAPLALVGARDRRWWAVVVGLALVNLAILPAWIDYLTAMRNAGIPPWYSLKDVPLACVGLVAAWTARPA